MIAAEPQAGQENDPMDAVHSVTRLKFFSGQICVSGPKPRTPQDAKIAGPMDACPTNACDRQAATPLSGRGDTL